MADATQVRPPTIPPSPPRAQMVRLPRLQSALRYRGDFQVMFHTHTAVELVYNLEGITRIDVKDLKGKEVGLPGGASVLHVLPANMPHNQWSASPWRSQCILYFDGAHLLDDAPRALDTTGDPLIGRWFEELCTLHESKVAAPDSVANGFLFALLTRISALEQQRRSAETLHPRLAQAVEFIHEHLNEDIDADTLASASCASYSHLSALFRAMFDCGPLKYQQNQRLSSAQKLLLNPYLSLDEVAARVGYVDANYFVRIFKKAYGVPPGKWRKQHIRAVQR